MDVFCITTNNPQFQKLLAESGEKQGVFAMTVSKWMTESGIHNRYPTLQELGITAMKSVKPGVVELFDSTPELANAVYEALGLINTSEIQLDGPKFNPDNYEAISYSVKINGEYAGAVSVDKDGYISSSIGMAGVELEKEFQGKGYGTKVYIALAEQLAKEGKTLKSEAFGKEDINKSANRVWKSLLNKGYAVDKGSYFEIQLKNKQQALQLYSQYLDTIFPGSQVKGINYHGTEYQQKFEKFDSKLSGTQTKEELITNGFWFTYQKDVAEDFGSNVLSVLLNIRNPYRAEARLTDSFPYIKTFPDQVESVNKAIKEGYDSAFIDVLENLEYGRGTTELVVFEPEQIHILGNKQDIEGFKEFLDKPATSKLASTAKKSDEDIIEELVQENKLERKCQ